MKEMYAFTFRITYGRRSVLANRLRFGTHRSSEFHGVNMKANKQVATTGHVRIDLLLVFAHVGISLKEMYR